MKIIGKLSLRAKLILVFTAVIVIHMSVSLYYTAQVNELMQFNQITQDVYYNVNSITGNVQSINRQLELYMASPNDVTLKAYQQLKEDITQGIARLTNKSNDTHQWYMIHAMQNSTQALFGEFDRVISKIHAQDSSNYLDYYAGMKILKYIPGYINEYLNMVLSENAREADVLAKKTNSVAFLSKMLLVYSALLCMAFAFTFSDFVTKPIRALSEAAREISRGQFNVPDVAVVNDDEIGLLIRTFNIMKEDIGVAIETLQYRTELEGRLYEEELKNLKNAELLHEAQYLALQSQINPHFLFNTLNVIARAVVHEDSKVATQLIFSLAELFRYNLSHLNTHSTLREELEIVEKYIYIQKYRFRERVQYRVSGRTDCDDAMIPSMLLQPLVENSLIHGIENLESGGQIIVDVTCKNDLLQLRVFDNGAGMDVSTRKSVCSDTGVKHTGHTTGIGLSNIRQRVELFQNGRMCIHSIKGRGTIVTIKIPLRREDSYHV